MQTSIQHTTQQEFYYVYHKILRIYDTLHEQCATHAYLIYAKNHKTITSSCT